MPDHIRDLLISLASHMAYMQGQLEAHHQFDELEDYYWYRESVELRQKVTDAFMNQDFSDLNQKMRSHLEAGGRQTGLR